MPLMKSLQKRRKFLTFAAASTASMGLVWKSFGASPAPHNHQEPVGKDGNVRRFGAKGDGKTDDTQAIQAAIDAGTGTVYFPKGSYRITAPLDLDLQKLGYTSMSGEGISLIVMAGPGPAIRVSGTHDK